MLDFSTLHEHTRPAVIAHRGVSNLHRENTIPAFQAAIEAGCDGIELDVRRTRDGVLVVHHNVIVKGTHRRLSTTRYSVLKDAARMAGYDISTLEEVLALGTGKIALDIELKEEGCEAAVVELVKQYYDLRNIVFTSFRDRVIRSVKEIELQARTGLILGLMNPSAFRARLRSGTLTRRLRRARADIVVPHRALITRTFCRRIEKSRLPIIAWTVNNAKTARRLSNRSVGAIITDVPQKIAPVLRMPFSEQG